MAQVLKFGAGGHAWLMFGAPAGWQRVLVTDVEGATLTVPVLAVRTVRRERRKIWNNSPGTPRGYVYGPTIAVDASRAIPSRFVLFPDKARKRRPMMGASWVWRVDAEPTGEPVDLDGGWHMYPPSVRPAPADSAPGHGIAPGNSYPSGYGSRPHRWR